MKSTLHSTMYLFLRFAWLWPFRFQPPLHSTMYLFLPTVHSLIICIVTQLYIPQCIYFYDTIKFKYKLTSSFTFHNVSISTQTGSLSFSAMWLYIPQCIYFYLESVKYLRYELDFTFHNVSISTCLAEDIKVVMCSLHSTMYLFLLPMGKFFLLRLISFTFHNVSISTIVGKYVVNTLISLYIPQCIYFYPVQSSHSQIQWLHPLFCRLPSLYQFYHKFILVITSILHITPYSPC